MVSPAELVRRLRRLASLPAEVEALRESIDKMNHVLTQLNHDVHAGSEDVLPLFLGYAERLRLDADTAIGAAQVIERQLSRLEDMIASLERDG